MKIENGMSTEKMIGNEIPDRVVDTKRKGTYFYVKREENPKKEGKMCSYWYMFDGLMKKHRKLVGLPPRNNGKCPTLAEQGRGYTIILFTEEENERVYRLILEWKEKYNKGELRDYTGEVAGEVKKEEEKVEEKKEEEVVKKEEKQVCLVEDKGLVMWKGGQTAEVRGDGRIWELREAFGAKVRLPMKEEDIKTIITGSRAGMKLEEELIALPGEEWRPSRGALIGIAVQLLQFNTEALCVLGKRREKKEGENEWIAVVPKQKVTTGSVDVDDFGKSMQLVIERGYKLVGTVHTHPGGGLPQCSYTDRDELWKGFGGIHFIISRDGGVRPYFSCGDVIWDIGVKDSIWEAKYLWEKDGEYGNAVLEDVEVTTEEGGYVLKDMVSEKQYVYKGVQTGKNNWGYKREESLITEDLYAWWSDYHGKWMCYDSKMGGIRPASIDEINKSLKSGTDERRWNGKEQENKYNSTLLVMTSDSIMEVMESLKEWKGRGDIKQEWNKLSVETKCFVGGFERYMKVMTKMGEQLRKDRPEQWPGHKAIDQIILNMLSIDEAIYGIQVAVKR